MPLIDEHFWLGTGPNTFREVFKPLNIPDYNKYIGKSIIYDANNEYLQVALTMGVPALLIYFIFQWMIIYRGIKQAQEMNGEAQILKYCLLAAVIGYMVQALFNISVVSVGPYFWIFLGLLANRTKGDEVTGALKI
ncbi:hypothetical protein G9U52_31560 [Paenibacillus sp. S3N08]|uniref:O-antigen polymerase n=1 Tax=Paenibacillus agricola TaxID=2716264 RepID=A0ABX0JGK6_9BACL|nr:hypothetical protein [Paenibacillus agricola]